MILEEVTMMMVMEGVENLLMETVLEMEETGMMMMRGIDPHTTGIPYHLWDEPGYIHLAYRQWWNTTMNRCTYG